MGLAANGLGYNQVPVAAALHIADLVVTMMVVYPHLTFSSAVPLDPLGRPRLFPDDLPGFSLDQAVHLFQLRNNGLHLLRKPAEAGVTVVAAAGGLLTVAVEEGPIGRQPELLPQPVFLKDSLPQFLGGNRKQFAGRCNADTGIQPKLRGDGFCGEPLATPRKRDTVARRRLAKQGCGEIDNRQFARLPKPADGGGVLLEVGVAIFNIQAKAKRISKRHRRDQDQAAGSAGKLLDGLLVCSCEVVQLGGAVE